MFILYYIGGGETGPLEKGPKEKAEDCQSNIIPKSKKRKRTEKEENKKMEKKNPPASLSRWKAQEFKKAFSSTFVFSPFPPSSSLPSEIIQVKVQTLKRSGQSWLYRVVGATNDTLAASPTAEKQVGLLVCTACCEM